MTPLLSIDSPGGVSTVKSDIRWTEWPRGGPPKLYIALNCRECRTAELDLIETANANTKNHETKVKRERGRKN